MISPALAGALVLSLLPLALELCGVIEVPGGPRVALVLLTWLGLAGLPRGRRPAPDLELPSLLMLAPLALAVAGDLGVRSAEQVVPVALSGVALVGLLSVGAARGGSAYSWLWTLLVGGPALLALAFGASATLEATGGPAGLGGLLAHTPLVWAASLLLDTAPASPLLPVGIGLLLAACALRAPEPAP